MSQNCCRSKKKKKRKRKRKDYSYLLYMGVMATNGVSFTFDSFKTFIKEVIQMTFVLETKPMYLFKELNITGSKKKTVAKYPELWATVEPILLVFPSSYKLIMFRNLYLIEYIWQWMEIQLDFKGCIK